MDNDLGYGMDIEKSLGKAYDLLADSRDAEAEQLLEECIASIKGALDGTLTDADRYHYWGLCLVGLEEAQQALLKFEQAVNIQPNHEGSLWQIASLLLYELDKPELAVSLLENRLIPAFSDNSLYTDALHDAEAILRIRKRAESGEIPIAGSEAKAWDGEASADKGLDRG